MSSEGREWSNEIRCHSSEGPEGFNEGQSESSEGQVGSNAGTVSQFSDLAHDPSLLNIDNYLKHVNPQLVSFIASATRTTRERRRNTDQDESEANDHVRKVRNYFILSLLLYCTNPKQPPPLHNLLADAVEVCGGSIGSY